MSELTENLRSHFPNMPASVHEPEWYRLARQAADRIDELEAEMHDREHYYQLNVEWIRELEEALQKIAEQDDTMPPHILAVRVLGGELA